MITKDNGCKNIAGLFFRLDCFRCDSGQKKVRSKHKDLIIFRTMGIDEIAEYIAFLIFHCLLLF